MNMRKYIPNLIAKPSSGNRSGAAKGGKKPIEKPIEKPEPNTLKLWVPNIFENDGPVFLMSATHRGDMYHFRAALQLENCSVILYDSNHTDDKRPKTKDLEEYLAESVLIKEKHIFIVPWGYDVLSGKNLPPINNNDCFLDRKIYDEKERRSKPIKKLQLGTYSESISTELIAYAITEAPKSLQDVVNGMTILGGAMENDKFPDFEKLEANFPDLSTKFAELWAKWKDDKVLKVESGENAILLMYRDTGTRDPHPVEEMGVYPELDNGNATEEIREILAAIAKQKNKPLTSFSCGLANSGIGEYWLDLQGLKPSDKITKRDFEAYFLKWSYEKKYYKMASGFRSGALDLFTFMGIPTVSIGLRNLMGEKRHQLLADEKFERVNIQYDQPRHKATAAVTSLRWTSPPPKDRTTFASPFWDEDFQPPEGAKKRDIPANKKAEQMQKAGGFALFDKIVIKTGYMIAFQKYMKWDQTVSTLKTNPLTDQRELPRTVTTSNARFCYPFGLSQDALGKYFDANEKHDHDGVMAMRSKLDKRSETLQQSETMIKKYEKEYNADWDQMTRLINEKKLLGPKPRKRIPTNNN